VKKYVFGLAENGQARIGTVLDYPDDYTDEGDEDVWNNQNRAFKVNGQWTIYDPLAVDVPASAATDETITATVTLPAGSPDTSVTFTVIFNGEAADPVAVDVVNGAASQQFAFDTPGTYRITASSEHHGAAVGEVVVS
jgi:hypothetical protein